ncbi:hypothetical protein VTP01DRAFT_8931 [Rhizomucor pusillus]|uniref:uncharacterized protein n=1 Tax=Rhizomucor pusillus TaxID=4840 RepID=UPI00374430A8
MLSRLATRTAQRVPRRSFIRMYSSETGSEGATVSSKGSFSDKEKAVENQWARLHDAEKIKQLREALEAQKEVTESLKKDIDELKKATGKQ